MQQTVQRQAASAWDHSVGGSRLQTLWDTKMQVASSQQTEFEGGTLKRNSAREHQTAVSPMHVARPLLGLNTKRESDWRSLATGAGYRNQRVVQGKQPCTSWPTHIHTLWQHRLARVTRQLMRSAFQWWRPEGNLMVAVYRCSMLMWLVDFI